MRNKKDDRWEPEVGGKYWFIGEALDGVSPSGKMEVFSRLRGGSAFCLKTVKDKQYKAHERSNNVFRTRAQAREVLKAFKYILECASRFPNLTGMSKWSAGDCLGRVMVEFNKKGARCE